MLAYVALLCLTASALAAGPCDSDAEKFYKCLKDSRPKPPEKQGGPDKRAGFEDFEKKRAACFTDKGCTIPPRQEKGKGPDGKGKEGFDSAKMKTCVDAAVPKIKTCIGNDHFPEPPNEFGPGGAHGGPGGPEKGPGGPHGGQGGSEKGSGGPPMDPRARAGTDCAAATAVNQCLDALKPPSESHEHGSEKQGSTDKGGREEWEKRREADCKARKDAEKKCEDLMTAACKKSLNDTKAKVCDCATKQKADFVACVGQGMAQHADMFVREACDLGGQKCEDEGPRGGPSPHKA